MVHDKTTGQDDKKPVVTVPLPTQLLPPIWRQDREAAAMTGTFSRAGRAVGATEHTARTRAPGPPRTFRRSSCPRGRKCRRCSGRRTKASRAGSGERLGPGPTRGPRAQRDYRGPWRQQSAALQEGRAAVQAARPPCRAAQQSSAWTHRTRRKQGFRV